MDTFKGTLKKGDLEGGVWILETEEGEIYHLHGVKENLYKNGKKVTIKGKIDENIMGTGMMGPVITVKEITE